MAMTAKPKIQARRKRKPREIAVINECCTGCAGSPVCQDLCPVEDCMYLVFDEQAPPCGRIEVNELTCIGCRKCITKGPEGMLLEGCPWDAIDMLPLKEYEATYGEMPY